MAKKATAAAKATKVRSFKTSLDLSAKTRDGVIGLLNSRLVDALDLYSQLKQAHWNVKGSDFIQLHELFDEIAASILGFVDEIAERGVQLGGYATGTVRMASEASSLPEYPLIATSGKEHVEALVERVALFGQLIRRNIDDSAALNDADTADLFTEISRAVDKHLWFLEAHIQS